MPETGDFTELFREFRKRDEFFEEICSMLEQLARSMYDFADRMDTLHQSLSRADDDCTPLLTAPVDHNMKSKLLDIYGNNDYYKEVAKMIMESPVHNFKRFFNRKGPDSIKNLVKNYNDVLDRKHHYCKKLQAMCDSYKRSVGRIEQKRDELTKVVSNHSNVIRVSWVQDELRNARSEAESMHKRLKKYIEHKQSADSKLVQRMRDLERQMLRVEQMRFEKVKDIMSEVVTKYTGILNNGSQQHQKAILDSLLMTLRNMDPDEEAEKWLDTLIGVIYRLEDMQHTFNKSYDTIEVNLSTGCLGTVLDHQNKLSKNVKETDSKDKGINGPIVMDTWHRSKSAKHQNTSESIPRDAGDGSRMAAGKQRCTQFKELEPPPIRPYRRSRNNRSEHYPTPRASDGHDGLNNELEIINIDDTAENVNRYSTWKFHGEGQLSVPKAAHSRVIAWAEDGNRQVDQTTCTTADDNDDVIGFDDNFGTSTASGSDHLTFRAIAYYEKQDNSQISLRPGMIINQISPVNNNGYCYGYKMDTHGEKTCGMYPACYVEEIHNRQ